MQLRVRKEEMHVGEPWWDPAATEWNTFRTKIDGIDANASPQPFRALIISEKWEFGFSRQEEATKSRLCLYLVHPYLILFAATSCFWNHLSWFIHWVYTRWPSRLWVSMPTVGTAPRKITARWNEWRRSCSEEPSFVFQVKWIRDPSSAEVWLMTYLFKYNLSCPHKALPLGHGSSLWNSMDFPIILFPC